LYYFHALKTEGPTHVHIQMNRTYIQILVLVLLTGSRVFAQQQPLYSQFTFNKYLFNPAVAGSENISVVKMTAYEQWVGFKGAPKFHTVTFDTRIFQQNRRPRRNIRRKLKLFKPGTVGTGVQLFNEKYGTLTHTGMNATYAFHMKMGSQQLSFGLSPVLSNLGLNSSEIVLSDEQADVLLLGDKTRRWILDFNFGAYLSAKDYYAGYSVHNVSKSSVQWGGSIEENYGIGRLHYFMGGYKYSYNRNLVFEPGMLIKLSEVNRSQNQLDISVKGIINQEYWGGLSYKTGNTLSLLGGLQLDRYFFAYAFDMTLSKIRKTNYGSHEILLAVQLGETTRRYRWLNVY